MFAADDSASLTIDELTWLSASTLIENQYALSESPDRGSRALFNTVFGDSQSELGVERDEDDESPPLSRRGSPPISTTPPRHIQALPGSGSPTPGIIGSDSSTSSSTHGSAETGSGAASRFQPGRQPITPPPTPPRHHLHPRYLSYDNYSTGALTPPSPSPSVSSSTLSCTSRAYQTEWLYRRPKTTNPTPAGGGAGNGALLTRHRSVNMSASASCSSRQVSRSPSICSSSYRNPCDSGATPARSSRHNSGKHRQQQQQQHAAAAAKPRPSSPVLISSTSQLVDASEDIRHGPPGLESAVSRSPSVCSGITTGLGGGLMKSGANASVSSLQSSIRVSPLKNRQGYSMRGGYPLVSGGGSSTSLQTTNSGSGSGVTGPLVAQPPQSSLVATVPTPKGLERCSSSASATTSRSTGKPIWSAIRARSGTVGDASFNASTSAPERNRILLKSIPSQSQISMDPSVTPTFVTPPPSASLPMFNSPRMPPRIRHTFSGASTASSQPSLPQKDKDRSMLRRDKFASAPPIPAPGVGVGARTPSPYCPSASSASLTSVGIPSAKNPLASMCHSSGSLSSLPYTSTMGPLPSSAPGGAPHPGSSNNAVKISSPSHLSRMGGGRKRSYSSSSTRVNDAGRDRTSSLTSQISIATATTAHTATTTRTTSSSASSIRSHPDTPSTPPLVPSAVTTSSKSIGRGGRHNFRGSSSNNSLMSTGTTPPNQHYQPLQLRGLGIGGSEKKSSLLLDRHQTLSYQYRHQRQSSTSSSVSFNDSGNGGSAAAAATAAARSQAYAQLTGSATATGPGRSPPSTGSKRRRPSTSPGSGSETSSSHSRPYGRHLGHTLGLNLGSGSSSSTGYGNALLGNGSASTLMPLSTSLTSKSDSITNITAPRASSSLPPPNHRRLTHKLSVALSDNGIPSSQTPLASHTYGLDFASLPKAKSILTRTSSMSTKNSTTGGTVKNVKFVETPEVHYRSGCYEMDGNEYVYGGDSIRDGDASEEGEDEEGHVAVGAKGEGQEGQVLKDCMGMDVDAIDMDIDTYLGSGISIEAEEGKESKVNSKKTYGLNWGFLSRGRKAEKENRREEDQSKDCIIPDLEQKKEEKEKSATGFGLRRLMGFGARKAPPPPLSILPSSTPGPKSLEIASPTEGGSEQKSGSNGSSPPVSPRKISGPYLLGSHLPSRSPPAHSSISSHSSSLLHHPISGRSAPASASNTSLNRTNGGRHYSYQHPSSPSLVNTPRRSNSRSHSIRSAHRTNPALTTVTNLGMSMERPVGPNIPGTRPKGFVVGADVLSLSTLSVPLKTAPSYESFRSSKSFGGRSVRSEVGSMKSAKSVGGGSLRSFRAWMDKVGGGCNGTGVTTAVAE